MLSGFAYSADVEREYREFGVDSGRGNVVGLQTWTTPSDYLTQSAFDRAMRGYFEAARARGWFEGRTVVVLPEYVGTWLVIIGEEEGVAHLSTKEEALQRVALAHPWPFASAFLRSWWSGASEGAYGAKIRHDAVAVFKVKARAMADAYLTTFSNLARDFGVTVVAGSIVLPKMTHISGHQFDLEMSGPLYNTTVIFKPNGDAYPITNRKNQPTPSELAFTAQGRLEETVKFETPVGALVVINCADSWFDAGFQWIESHGGAEVVAVPSFVDVDGKMNRPWSGVRSAPWPDGYDDRDRGTISYNRAWEKYASPGRVHHLSRKKNVMNVFLRGRWWDLGSDGNSIVIQDGSLHRGRLMLKGDAIHNLWL